MGNLDLDFKIRISDLQSNAKSETDFNAEISVFGFSFLPFDWEIRKRILKTVCKNSGLARARILAKRRPLFTRIVLQILFQISQSNDKKGNPKNPDLDFLIEIHPEDRFLGGEILFRISCSIGKSGFRF